MRIPLHRDIVTIDHVARLMAGHLHDMLLGNTCQSHVACRCTSEVVEMVVGDSGLVLASLSVAESVRLHATGSSKYITESEPPTHETRLHRW